MKDEIEWKLIRPQLGAESKIHFMVPENHNTSNWKASWYILAVVFAIPFRQFVSKQRSSALLMLFSSSWHCKLCQVTTLLSKKIQDLQDVMPYRLVNNYRLSKERISFISGPMKYASRATQPWSWRLTFFRNCRQPFTSRHWLTSQKTWILIQATLGTSDLARQGYYIVTSCGSLPTFLRHLPS
jgi:hypothetical protein